MEQDINKIVRNIKSAFESESNNNQYYTENQSFYYDTTLNDDDKSGLYEKTKFSFNVIENIINQYLKQIQDSAPSIKVSSASNDM